jgi:RNA polymerase sigma-70 factor, ECF subfamily
MPAAREPRAEPCARRATPLSSSERARPRDRRGVLCGVAQWGHGQLRSLLAEDVAFTSDGGGKRPAAKRPLVGVDEVMRFHAWIARAFAERTSRLVRYGFINGLPGFVTVEPDGPQTTAFEIKDDKGPRRDAHRIGDAHRIR